MDNREKRDVAIEYLSDLTGYSEEEVDQIIDQLKNNETDSLLDTRLKYSTMIETILESYPNGGIVFFDHDLRYQITRGRGLEKAGLDSDEMEGKTIWEIFPEETCELLEPFYREALDGKEKELNVEYRDRTYRVYAYPVYQGEKIAGGVVITWDISSEIKKEKTLKLLKKVFESSTESIIITDAKDNIGEEEILFVNSGFEQNTGYTREEVIGRNPAILQGPDTDDEVISDLVETLSRGKRFEGETFNYRKDGTRYRVRWSIDPVRNDSGEITHFVSVQNDITKQWNQKEKLKKTLKERELLIREVHHRVKNNLSVISGLLDLQSRRSDSEEAQKILSESKTRIRSIAAVHEKLYNSSDLTSIEMDEYIEDLLSSIRKSIPGHSGPIEIKTDLDKIILPVPQAVPVGLLINELVTNSYKHAFGQSEQGFISINLDQEGESVLLEVRDNGRGLPDNFGNKQTESLGITLIETLGTQLKGDYKFAGDNNGTRFAITFPKKK